MSKVKFGVLGAGAIGQVHMKQIKNCEDTVCLGVFDPYKELAKNAVKDGLAEKTYDSPEALLDVNEIDAVIVASPNKTHVGLGIKAMEAGKHVIVEKPLGLTGKDAARIAKVAKDSGLVTMVPHQMRWSPGSQKLKSLSDKGELGNVYYVKSSWLRQAGIPGWGSWFTRFEESGGGPLVDIGVHMLDLALYQMGNPKPVTVFGSTYAEFGPRKKGIGGWGTPDWDGFYDVEDLAGAMITMDNGATLVLEVSWAANLSDDLADPKISLLGTEAGASLTPDGNVEMSAQKFGQPFSMKLNAKGPDTRQAMLKHFIDCVKEGKQTIAPIHSGMVNNVILDAIYESAKTGKSVDIDWDSYEK